MAGGDLKEIKSSHLASWNDYLGADSTLTTEEESETEIKAS
jgi:hypothetical protein